METEEMKQLLVKMGLREEAAEHYLQYESEIWAVLPAFRLLKPLSDQLEFYKGSYRKMLENRLADGTLEKRLPKVSALMKSGAAPEDIEAFAYDLVLEAFESILYQLDDHQGAEVSDVFLEEDVSKCGYARLMEQGPEGEATGRYLFEVHGMIPFSDL